MTPLTNYVCTTNDHFFSLEDFQIHTQFGNKIVKNLALKLSPREKFVTEKDDIFPWVVVIRKFIQNRF